MLVDKAGDCEWDVPREERNDIKAWGKEVKLKNLHNTARFS